MIFSEHIDSSDAHGAKLHPESASRIITGFLTKY